MFEGKSKRNSANACYQHLDKLWKLALLKKGVTRDCWKSNHAQLDWKGQKMVFNGYNHIWTGVIEGSAFKLVHLYIKECQRQIMEAKRGFWAVKVSYAFILTSITWKQNYIFMQCLNVLCIASKGKFGQWLHPDFIHRDHRIMAWIQ